MAGKDSGKDSKLAAKVAKLAKNDAKYGRGSKSNPNNKPNGGSGKGADFK